MALPAVGARAALWLGTVARLIAFVGLFLAIGVVLTPIAYALPAGGYGLDIAGTGMAAAAALVAGVLLLRFADRRPAAALGIGVSRETPRHLLIGLGIGTAALAVAAVALLVTRSVSYSAQPGSVVTWTGVVLAHAAVFAVAALAEEALFRGYAFQVLARAGGPVLATVASSVLFALVHRGNPDVGVFALINIFLAGVLLAVAYLRTLSLWFVTALHMGWNWAMATLFDLHVSGLKQFDTPLYEPAVTGPVWWTGGEFGPEGGVIGTLGFAVALIATMRLRTVRPDARIAQARPLMLDEAAVATGEHEANDG